MGRPRICLIMGDPCGIGPEVSAKLLAAPETRARADFLLLGDREVFADGQRVAGVSLSAEEVASSSREAATGGLALLHVPFRERGECPPGEVHAESGRNVLEVLCRAAEIGRAGDADAAMFAPLNKQAMMLGGMNGRDELEHLTAHLGIEHHVCEINSIGELWTSRVTNHVPLAEVATNVTENAVSNAIRILDDTLRRAGVDAPRLAVAALNPHAGEGGLLGREEIDVIGPAIEKARAEGIDATGPMSPDTMFVRARREGFHGIVPMYHDQSQIAMKLIGFEQGITVLAGLPFPMTTPAHGTAFDIVGRGVANADQIGRAFDLAVRLANRPVG